MFECSSETINDRGLIKERKIQLRRNRAKQVHAPHELFDFMIQIRELEVTFAASLSEGSTGRLWFHLPLMLEMNDEIVKANLFNGGNTFVRAIKEVFHLNGKLLWKRLLNPLAFHRGGQAKEDQIFGTTRGDFANAGDNKQW